eukprot:TRINITY_DN5478_c0_g1_i2.p1 TRINITY_DN5478_c0_g1~~TRINITY_DN5478_c0_g1_i2.p1  ORF type:complete len:873 (+),score=109.92 TRINITY_DN5478_c0_g1_i2:104-2620(+)
MPAVAAPLPASGGQGFSRDRCNSFICSAAVAGHGARQVQGPLQGPVQGVGAVANILGLMEREVSEVAPKKEALRKCVEDAVRESLALAGCRVEVVGSTSWGGAVPQSDLDLVILTPGSEDLEGRDAVVVLEDLRRGLETLPQESRTWKTLEVLHAPRVPVLRMHEAKLSCDVSVDQRRCLHHRAVMLSALEGRPQIRSFIQLVKFWLRRRGIPMAAEGGLASLAWAVVALRLAEEQPVGSSVERLLWHFFSRMQLLGEYSLSIEHMILGGARFSWSPRHATQAWSEEWTQLLWVDDPTMPACAVPTPQSGPLGITPPSIPSALVVLYVAELRLAWKALQEGLWDDLWQPAPPEELSRPSPLETARLHSVLKNGTVFVGKLQEVRPCPSLQRQEVLHRRDQSSVLVLEPYKVNKDSVRGKSPVSVNSEDLAPITCQPCHWICSLPAWYAKPIPGKSMDRLREIMEIVAPKEDSCVMQVGAFVPVATMCDANTVAAGVESQSRPFNLYAIAIPNGQGVFPHPCGQVAMVPVWPQMQAASVQNQGVAPQQGVVATPVPNSARRPGFGQQVGTAATHSSTQPASEHRRRSYAGGRCAPGQQANRRPDKVPSQSSPSTHAQRMTHSDESTRASDSDDHGHHRGWQADSGNRGTVARRGGPRRQGQGPPVPPVTAPSHPWADVSATAGTSTDKGALPKGMLPAGRVIPSNRPSPPTDQDVHNGQQQMRVHGVPPGNSSQGMMGCAARKTGGQQQMRVNGPPQGNSSQDMMGCAARKTGGVETSMLKRDDGAVTAALPEAAEADLHAAPLNVAVPAEVDVDVQSGEGSCSASTDGFAKGEALPCH